MSSNKSYFAKFSRNISNLLPTHWVSSFGTYEMFSFFGLDCHISVVYNQLNKTQLEAIMKLCIETVDPEFDILCGNSPYAVLKAINKQKNAMDKLAHHFKNTGTDPSKIQLVLDKGKFTGEMYALTRSEKCKDPKYILSIYCNEPAKRIQKLWQRYRRNKSAKVIQSKVKEWLYQPGGVMMKKAESHFYKMSGR